MSWVSDGDGVLTRGDVCRGAAGVGARADVHTPCLARRWPRTQAARANPEVRRSVAKAVINALVASPAEVDASKVVVRFGEAVDGFPLPAGHTAESTKDAK